MPDSKPALRKDRVRFIYLLKRRKDLTHEEFSKYWSNVHSRVFIGSRVAHQYTLRYDQMHVSPATMKAWSDKYGIPAPTYDGIALLEADSFEDLEKVLDSTEYKTRIGPDEHNFIDHENSQIIPMNVWTGFDHTKARL
ncbi:EthD domain-containing protein [Schizophyllum commune]